MKHLCKEDALASKRFRNLGEGEHLKLAMDVKARQIQIRGKACHFNRWLATWGIYLDLPTKDNSRGSIAFSCAVSS